ncbi:hypothetical protein [Qipengyuania sp. DGS5-3]|uniref:hypothetical protein n=1 Tax=Qipengyuania sp. DGS5-3 TaxID=3349632 RepID=UPI0036D33F32
MNDNHAIFWPLIDAYETIEENISDTDPWMQIATWTMHQCLMKLAKTRVINGNKCVRISDVTLAMFDKFLRENLLDESWEVERRLYVESNGPHPLAALGGSEG